MITIRDRWIRHFEDAIPLAQKIQIISPFITQGIVNDILSGFNGEGIEVITRFNLNDFRLGVSSLDALELLLSYGASIQGIRNLHSKVYIFDDSTAIVTSANLTSSAFFNNYEFGVKVTDNAHVQGCLDYFNWLKIRGGRYLDNPTIRTWREEIGGSRPLLKETVLPDYGANLTTYDIEKRYFIKFLGKSDNRAALDLHSREEIESAHCHYALCYPTNRGRPRRYRDGDIVYIARMLDGTNYSLFGRAECLRHVDERDNASEEEIEILDWKERWPIYIRVKNAEFIDASMGNCPKMSDLIGSLEAESFESTSKRLAAGEIDIKPWNSLRQQADVQLSLTAAMWLERQFDQCMDQYGRVDKAFIESLFPGSPY